MEGCRTVLLFLWLGLEDNWCGRVRICMHQDNRLRQSEIVGASSFCCPFTDRAALGLTHHELSLDLCPSLQGLKDIVVSSLHSPTSLMHVENWNWQIYTFLFIVLTISFLQINIILRCTLAKFCLGKIFSILNCDLSHRIHFQTKQLSGGQRCKFTWSIWIWAKSAWGIFSLRFTIWCYKQLLLSIF